MEHQFEEKPEMIQHFSHRHALNLTSLPTVVGAECGGCFLLFTGPAYFCSKCAFWLDESCSQLPPQINHDFHPLHPLIAQPPTSQLIYCNACQQKHKGLAFRCDECNFSLDAVCAMLTPTFKHKLHQHKLLYFMRPISHQNPFICNICGRKCHVPFYRCVECNFNLHFRCVLPKIVQHKCHIHPLTLRRDKVVEDESGEYYCDVCETERNGDHAVYYCEECTVVAHIECIITEENSYTSLGNVELYSEGLTAEEMEEEVSDDENHAPDKLDKTTQQIFKEMAPSVSKMEIQHVSHEHILQLCEVMNEDSRCYGCLLNISGPAYFCEICHFFLHKSCAELDPKIQHPFHSLHHLTLLLKYDEDGFVCDECRTVSKGFCFNCSDCNFNLDMKCAALTHHPLEYEDKRTRKLQHFSDRHALSFYNIAIDKRIVCVGCQVHILGPAYGCHECHFWVHESCSQMPKEIQHDFHPLHPLIGQEFDRHPHFNCGACGQDLNRKIHYGCEDCIGFSHFYLCMECASLIPTLKHQRHEHKLIYFTPKGEYFWCNVCGKKCVDPFYRCVQCNFDLHVECTPLPAVVEHKCHMHPLTLMDKYIEDGWDEQCCDVCETERNADHGVYYCVECNFAAHIECVITT